MTNEPRTIFGREEGTGRECIRRSFLEKDKMGKVSGPTCATYRYHMFWKINI